ncbi:hypothetical protein ACFU8Q_32580 [Streptomyces sp. NPDC057543]|uniref:hypothetical protein n=1 Tax=Streptomyces sp. NPDC057543 TaxID=3346163 RepID=UPI0036C334C8
MGPTSIAALLALTSIPVSVLVARWQARTALAQVEATSRSAIAQAEATYRAAVDAVEAKANADREQWLRIQGVEACARLLSAVDALRSQAMPSFLRDRGEIHGAYYMVEAICSTEVASRAQVLDERCTDYIRGFHEAPAEREDLWDRVRGARQEFTRELRAYLGGDA